MDKIAVAQADLTGLATILENMPEGLLITIDRVDARVNVWEIRVLNKERWRCTTARQAASVLSMIVHSAIEQEEKEQDEQ